MIDFRAIEISSFRSNGLRVEKTSSKADPYETYFLPSPLDLIIAKTVPDFTGLVVDIIALFWCDPRSSAT